MTEKEAINVKVGDELWVVVFANAEQVSNPFLRTGRGFEKRYSRPLGIFKTTLKEITERDNKYDWIYVKGRIDNTPFKHLVWEGHYNNIPKDKRPQDYCTHSSDWFVAMYEPKEGPNHKTPNAQFVEHMFFTEEDAKKYFDNKTKAFKKNMKTYMSHLKSEIETAKKNIEDAQKQINYYENIF